jgi:hypothetical protein
MIFVLVGSLMIATAANIALFQLNQTTQSTQRNDALQTAMTGLGVAVGDLRAANQNGTGELSMLPCTPGTSGFTLTGTTGPTGGAIYTVQVTYFQQDANPTAYNLSTTGWTTAHQLQCAGDNPPQVPGYALLLASAHDPGQGAVTSRTVEQTYGFYLTNQNIPGGLIYDYNWQTDNLCMTDPATTPAAGDLLYVETCNPGAPSDTWAYTTQFTLELTNTETTSSPLCITDNDNDPTVTTVAQLTLSLAACPSSSTTNVPYNQQWGVDDTGDFEPVSNTGSAANISGTVCLTETAEIAGAQLQLQSCQGGFTTSQTWQPAPTVGAGDSGPALQQFVNYQEFGRCIDVTNQNPASMFLIDYMCKQFPDGVNTTSSDPTWNQRFATVPVSYIDSSGTATWELLETTDSGTTYCLTSPLTTVSLAQGQHSWATVTPCPTVTNGQVAPGNTQFLWNVNTSSSYTIQDYNNNCLETDSADQQYPVGNTDLFSTIAVNSCTGSNAQKWNAPATLEDSGVINTFEPTGNN